MKTSLRLLVLLLLPVAVMAQPNSYDVQLTVWNMTTQTIDLNCMPQNGVTVQPQNPIIIAANDSPPILLTSDHYGDLVSCTVAGTDAKFTYSLFKNKEYVEIDQLPTGQPNFHYDPSYPGALTYK